jgi:hypothetical protein
MWFFGVLSALALFWFFAAAKMSEREAKVTRV